MATTHAPEHPAVARIRDRVKAEHVNAALLSHREVVEVLGRLLDHRDLVMPAKVKRAAELLGLDQALLASVLIAGLSPLEHPRDTFHFDVLAERSWGRRRNTPNKEDGNNGDDGEIDDPSARAHQGAAR